jgi:hypothetical protein
MNRFRKAGVLLPTLILGYMAALVMVWPVMGYAAESAVLDGWTVTAGSIETVKSTTVPKSKRVKGSFEFKSTLPESGSRLGGACLIADLTDQGVGLKSCQSDEQCNTAYQAAPNSKLGSGPSGPSLYCLGKSEKDSAKRCWIRPGTSAAFCRKAPSLAQEYSVPAEVAGQPDSDSVNADPLGTGKRIHWRVAACLNPAVFPPSPNGPPCADPTSDAEVHSHGKVKKVKP